MRQRAGVLLLAVLLVAAVPLRGERASGAAPGVDPCAVIDSCSLGELGARSGIEVGFFYGPTGDPAREALSVRHSTMYTNHAFSWKVMEPARGVYDFGPADANAAFAAAHGLRHQGFHFAWDNATLDDFPEWAAAITDPDELRATLRARARVIFDRYPTLRQIDVINEPLEGAGGRLHPNHFADVLGPDYVLELFEIVGEEAPPGVALTINENLVEYFPEKADGLVELARSVVDAGLRIDGVGLQSHFFFGGEPDWALYRSTMERLGALGLEVSVSELDVPVGPVPDRFEVQADRYRAAAETCLAVAACTQFFIWGLDDSASWLDWFLGPGLDPLPFDADLQPKPAYDALYRAFLAGRPVASPSAPPSSVDPTASSAPTVGAAALPTAVPVAPAFTG